MRADQGKMREMMYGLAQLPSTAFGDGSHPTTRACARAVDWLCRTRTPKSVLDVGTGTGILARIARQRGATFVVGTDIDPIALEAARRNVALDVHPVAIELTAAAPDAWGPRFDLVVANILEGPLVTLAPALRGALAPGGTLVLSGFMPAQVPSLRVVFGELSETRDEGWSVLVGTPR